MKKSLLFLAASAFFIPSFAQTDYTKGLSIWFDKPNDLSGMTVWFNSQPGQWVGENKPESAGDTMKNPDAEFRVFRCRKIRFERQFLFPLNILSVRPGFREFFW